MAAPANNPFSDPRSVWALTGLWWTLLFLLLVLSSILGPIASLLALITALLIGMLVGVAAWRDALNEPFAKLFLGGFSLMAVTTLLTSKEPADALNVMNFVPMVLALPVYAIAKQHRGPKAVVMVALFCFAGVLTALAVGILDLSVFGKSRAEGILNNAIVYGRTAAVIGFLALGGYFVVEDRRRYFFLLAPVLGAIVLVLSGTRGGMLALPAAFLISFAAIIVHSRQRAKVLAVSALLLLALSVAAYFAQSQTHSRMESLVSVGTALLGGNGEVDNSTSHRLRMYDTGIQAFLESPILGHGWANLIAAASHYMEDSEAFRVFARQNQNHLHNDVLNFAVASGVPGILAFLLFLFAPLIQLVRRRDRFSSFVFPLSYLGSLTAIYAVAGLFDMTIGYDVSTTLFAFSTALVVGIHDRTPSSNGAA